MCGDKGHIRHPFSLRCLGATITLEQIGSVGRRWITLRFVRVSPLSAGTETLFLHQPDNAFFPTMHPLFFEFCMDTRTSIHAPILLIRIFKTHRKLFIIPFSLTFPSFAPIEVPVLRDPKRGTEASDGKNVTMSLTKSKLYEWGCAKMLTAFLRYPSLDAISHFLALLVYFPLLSICDVLFLEMLLLVVHQTLCTIYLTHSQKYQDLWLFVFWVCHWSQTVALLVACILSCTSVVMCPSCPPVGSLPNFSSPTPQKRAKVTQGHKKRRRSNTCVGSAL
jgi:hypothetical protein